MQNRINNLGEYVIDRSVEIRNGQYGKWNYQKDKEPRFVPMGTAVYLEKILINADTAALSGTYTAPLCHGTKPIFYIKK